MKIYWNPVLIGRTIGLIIQFGIFLKSALNWLFLQSCPLIKINENFQIIKFRAESEQKPIWLIPFCLDDEDGENDAMCDVQFIFRLVCNKLATHYKSEICRNRE